MNPSRTLWMGNLDKNITDDKLTERVKHWTKQCKKSLLPMIG